MAGQFTFDGKAIPFQAGDTIGSALHRAGVKVIARSMKYHRPRGLYCCTGSCASCLVDVDGVPNTPACMAACRDGAQVASQNRLGSAKHDLYAVTDKVFARGFDPHAMFTKPRVLNDAFLLAVRHMSGVGKAPQTLPAGTPPRRFVHQADELVVGGGLHGLRRAKEAAGKGRKVLLVEELPTLGGSANWDPSDEEALALAKETPTWPGVEAWTGAVAFGVYDGVVGVMKDGDLHEVHAARTTVAAGRHDAWPLFANNDLPGVLSLRGAKRLLHQHGVLPGRRVVGHPRLPDGFAAALRKAGCEVVAQGEVTEAKGGTSVTHAKVGGAWVACEAIVCDLPGTPRVELLQQAGCALGFRGGVLANQKATLDGATTRPGVFALFTEGAA